MRVCGVWIRETAGPQEREQGIWGSAQTLGREEEVEALQGCLQRLPPLEGREGGDDTIIRSESKAPGHLNREQPPFLGQPFGSPKSLLSEGGALHPKAEWLRPMGNKAPRVGDSFRRDRDNGACRLQAGHGTGRP